MLKVELDFLKHQFQVQNKDKFEKVSGEKYANCYFPAFRHYFMFITEE